MNTSALFWIWAVAFCSVHAHETNQSVVSHLKEVTRSRDVWVVNRCQVTWFSGLKGRLAGFWVVCILWFYESAVKQYHSRPEAFRQSPVWSICGIVKGKGRWIFNVAMQCYLIFLDYRFVIFNSLVLQALVTLLCFVIFKRCKSSWR